MYVLIIDDDVEDTELSCKAMDELFPETRRNAINVCPSIVEAVAAARVIQKDKCTTIKLIQVNSHGYLFIPRISVQD